MTEADILAHYPHKIVATFRGEDAWRRIVIMRYNLPSWRRRVRRAFAATSKANAFLVIFIRMKDGAPDTIGIRYYMDTNNTADEEGEENMFEDWAYEWIEQPECSPMLRKIVLGIKS
jgi:hypothetical protein